MTKNIENIRETNNPTSNIESEIRRLSPWLFRFTINGIETGGDYPLADDPKPHLFAQEYSNARTVLELGSCEGYVSFNLSKQVERVVAIEGRLDNVKKAEFLKPFLDPNNRVEFIHGDIEAYNLGSLGTFDVVFCSGILYHLPEPWKLIRQLPLVSNNLFLSTHYCLDAESPEVAEGLIRGRWFPEGGFSDPLSGLSERSFWLTIGSLVDLLRSAGYTTIKTLGQWNNPPSAPLVILSASTR